MTVTLNVKEFINTANKTAEWNIALTGNLIIEGGKAVIEDANYSKFHVNIKSPDFVNRFYDLSGFKKEDYYGEVLLHGFFEVIDSCPVCTSVLQVLVAVGDNNVDLEFT